MNPLLLAPVRVAFVSKDVQVRLTPPVRVGRSSFSTFSEGRGKSLESIFMRFKDACPLRSRRKVVRSNAFPRCILRRMLLRGDGSIGEGCLQSMDPTAKRTDEWIEESVFHSFGSTHERMHVARPTSIASHPCHGMPSAPPRVTFPTEPFPSRLLSLLCGSHKRSNSRGDGWKCLHAFVIWSSLFILHSMSVPSGWWFDLNRQSSADGSNGRAFGWRECSVVAVESVIHL